MDLNLYARVLWRFRLLVGIGVLLAILLAFLSFVKVGWNDGPSVTYRETEEWESLSTLFVTSEGVSWASVVDPTLGPATEAGEGAAPQPSSTYLASLAGLYVQMATTDPVMEAMRKEAPINGKLQAFTVSADPDKRGEPLPMLTLSATAGTPEAAQRLGARHVDAFIDFLRERQREAGLAPDKRVKVEVVREPQPATLLKGRGISRPIMILLALLGVTVGAAFVLENLRPRMRVVPVTEEPVRPELARRPVRRRSA